MKLCCHAIFPCWVFLHVSIFYMKHFVSLPCWFEKIPLLYKDSFKVRLNSPKGTLYFFPHCSLMSHKNITQTKKRSMPKQHTSVAESQQKCPGTLTEAHSFLFNKQSCSTTCKQMWCIWIISDQFNSRTVMQIMSKALISSGVSHTPSPFSAFKQDSYFAKMTVSSCTSTHLQNSQ